MMIMMNAICNSFLKDKRYEVPSFRDRTRGSTAAAQYSSNLVVEQSPGRIEPTSYASSAPQSQAVGVKWSDEISRRRRTKRLAFAKRYSRAVAGQYYPFPVEISKDRTDVAHTRF
jgi:hypothetical protein